MKASVAKISKGRIDEAILVMMPIRYWMLECPGCGKRRAVHDFYLEFVGSKDPDPMPGSGFSGPPLPERYKCTKGCPVPIKVIGSVHGPGDREMWLHEPYKQVEMSKAQIKEWARLISQADKLADRKRRAQRVFNKDGELLYERAKRWWHIWD